MVKVLITVKEHITFDKDIPKFREELLNQLSRNAKVIFEKNTPIDSGRGANAYKITKKETQHELRNTTRYLPWVNDGTGLYGPRHTRIVPKNARVLHFHWKGKEWFLKSVKGQKGQKFVERSMSEVMRSVEGAVVIAANKTLK